jgi:hypothetical protein
MARFLEIRIDLENDDLTHISDVTAFLNRNAARIEAVAAVMGRHGALIDLNGNTSGGVYSRDNAPEFKL